MVRAQQAKHAGEKDVFLVKFSPLENAPVSVSLTAGAGVRSICGRVMGAG